MKNLKYIIICMSMLSAISCTKETVSNLDSRRLGIVVNKSVSQEHVTKTVEDDPVGIPYLFEVGGDTLRITGSVSLMGDPIPSEGDSGMSSSSDIETKGAVIESVGDKFNQFTLSILNLDGTGFYTDVEGTLGSQIVTYENGEWTTNQVWWPVDKDEKLLFFAYNAETTDRFVGEYTFHKNLDFSLRYRDDGGTAGKSAEEEKDIIYAVNLLSRSQGIKRAHDTAIGLQFHHLLAGLKFNFGQITSGLTLTNIAIDGLKTDQTCYYKYSDQSITWTPTDTASAVTLSQDFNMATASNTSCDDTTGTRTFFIPPQDIPADATISYTLRLTESDETVTKTFNLKDVLKSQTKWEAGKLYTYTLSANIIFAELGQTMSSICTSLGVDYKTAVKTVKFSVDDNTVTKAVTGGVEVQSSRSLTPIYATFDSSSGELVLHTSANKIFFPENSSLIFYDLESLTSIQNLEDVDTRNVTNMAGLFAQCYAITSLDLSSLKTSNVTDMGSMFYYCPSLTSLNMSNFDTSNVTSIQYMFAGCSSLTSLDVSNFDTSKVTDMMALFYMCTGLTSLDLSQFNTSNVKNMSYMLGYCSGLTSQDVVSTLNTSNVTNMSYMFINCTGLTSLDVLNFDTSNVKNMGYMFDLCSGLTSLDVLNFNTSKVEDMRYLFGGCTGLTSLDVSNFDTSNVTNMGAMFFSCSGLTSLDLSTFNTSKVTNMGSLFSNCSGLTSLNMSNFDTSNVTNMRYMFTGCSKLTSLDISNFNTSKATNMSGMFTLCSGLTSLNVSNFNTSKVTDMSNMFYQCSKLTSLDISEFDTSNVTNMGSMFNTCSGLTSLDVSNFNTSNVVDMNNMFYRCSALTSLDVSNFNTSKVTDMGDMFNGCSALTSLGVSNFNTSKVTDMQWMFCSCSALTSLDVSNFDTSNVTNMGAMFYSCSGLTSLDVSKFVTSNVTDMDSMFNGCSSLTSLDVSKFNTSKVKDMNAMFSGCSSLTSLDLSNFNTSNVSGTTLGVQNGMQYLLSNCLNLETLKLGTEFKLASSITRMLSGTFKNNKNATVTCTADIKAALLSTTATTKFDTSYVTTWNIIQ